ncbi:MAG: hypothetical protein LH473_08240, partial [Chitinophagales bacterium]|nr:hypothetical protein [Chitinophagales bacterium]
IGLLGALFHFKKNKNDAFVVLLFFFFTGLAIVLYLNQTPIQPRERDYAYAGSVYAFTIWIGIGVLWLFDLLLKRTSPKNAAIAAILIAAVAPTLMGVQGWDDHDRSNRYTARDMGRNYLESCAPNAILFTQGDNDTYPLWYAQEVEGIRTDVRIVNLSLLGVDWYIDELRRKINGSEAVILSMDSDSYRGSNRDYVRYYENKSINQNQYYAINTVLDFIFSNDPKKMLDYGNDKSNYLPTKNIFIPVDKNEIIKGNVVQPSDTSKILDRIEWKLNKGTLLKNDILTLEILRSNLWKRPIYFAISVSPDSYLGLNNYFQQEGLTYRLVPYVCKTNDRLPGAPQADLMYNNIMNKFAWGGVDKHEVYLDENVLRMVTNMRSNFSRLSAALIAAGKKDSAIKVLDKCMVVMPEYNVPLTPYDVGLAFNYSEAGAYDKSKKLLERMLTITTDQLRYYTSQDAGTRRYFNDDINEGLYVINNCANIAEKNGDKEFSDKAKATLEKYYNFYTPQNQ